MHTDHGIVFAEREGFRALELDLYRTSAETPGPPSPLIVYVHGGGWRQSHRGRPPRETRDWSPGFFARLTAAGFVVAAPSYRFSGEATFPLSVTMYSTPSAGCTVTPVNWASTPLARTAGGHPPAGSSPASPRSFPADRRWPASCAGTR